MKKKKYISPEFDKFDVELIRDCLDASAPGGQGLDLGEDDWFADSGDSSPSPLVSPDPRF